MNIQEMDFEKIFTWGIPLVGLIVTIVLAIKKFRKDKKSIKITLEYYLFTHTARLQIVNVKNRPITIAGITAMFPDIGDIVPANVIDTSELPKTLQDGEQITIDLGVLGTTLMDEERKCTIIVRDSEGKAYSKIKEKFMNEKFGLYSSPPRKWKRRVG